MISNRMISIKAGFLGGVWATFVISAMMAMNNATHAIPELHLARTLSSILGVPDHAIVGWIAHFVIGTILFGIAFAVLAPRIPFRSNLVKGLAFGLLTWLGMMVIFMPLGGAGFFAATRGPIAPIAALVLNLVYGSVLGVVYGRESGPIKKVESANRKSPHQGDAIP